MSIQHIYGYIHTTVNVPTTGENTEDRHNKYTTTTHHLVHSSAVSSAILKHFNPHNNKCTIILSLYKYNNNNNHPSSKILLTLSDDKIQMTLEPTIIIISHLFIISCTTDSMRTKSLMLFHD